jgi:hypothetical protein
MIWRVSGWPARCTRPGVGGWRNRHIGPRRCLAFCEGQPDHLSAASAAGTPPGLLAVYHQRHRGVSHAGWQIMGQLQVPLLDVVKTALEAAVVRHRRQLLRGVRLFNDLSAKPDICNPMTAGSPTAGSQMGSQRRQTVTDAGRPTATIGAGNWLIRRRPATVHDGPIAPEKRKIRTLEARRPR